MWDRRRPRLALATAVACASVLVGCVDILGFHDLPLPEDGGISSVDAAMPPFSEDASARPDAKASGPDAAPPDAAPDVVDAATADTGVGAADSSPPRDAADAADVETPDAGPSCLIGGTVYAGGTVDPEDSCQSCQPATSTSAWSFANGAPCGAVNVCTLQGCAPGCFIDGSYYAPNATNPTNACLSCQPATSLSAWSNVEGAICAAGEVCNGGACAAGCYVSGAFYGAGAANPSNPCQTCQPDASTTAWSTADGVSCGSGDVCNGASCVSGCFIDAAYVAANALDSTDPCLVCLPGTSTTAWSNVTDGIGCGNGQICGGGTCGTQCDIGGTLFPSGTSNPANGCQTCQPGTSTTAWSNADGTSCGTGGEVCSAAACTAGCFIAGAFYAPAAPNGTNLCQVCQPASSTTAWTDANGASCAPGEVCSGASCIAGCFIGGAVYTATTVEIGDSCESCQPATSTTGWTSGADGASCGTGEVCSGGGCILGCYIGGAVYTSGSLEGDNACQTCQPAASTTGWTSVSDGTSCGTGDVCGGGSCIIGCYIGGVAYAPGAIESGDECESCQPTTSTTTWTSAADGSGCGSGEVCSGGSCIAGCYIGSAVYSSGAIESGDECESCQPSESTTDWTVAADGAPCGAGDVCSGGSCIAGCYIGGAVYTPGTFETGDECESCQPTTSTTTWTGAADGMSCGSGQVCSGGTCIPGCYIGSAVYTSGATESGNACQTCQPPASTTTWTGLSNGTSCGTGDVCNGGSCISGCYIGGAVYAPNSAESGNACETCVPATSTTGWTTSADGTGCAAGDVCSGGNCISGCYIGGSVYLPGTVESGSPCESCAPGSSTTTWTSAADGTACGTSQICSSGSCVCATPTVLSGYVYDPGNSSPIYGATVYVPTSAPAPMPVGVVCGCGTVHASASTTTGIDGSFSLTLPPTTGTVTLVVQIGKWQRVFSESVTMCAATSTGHLTLPSTHLEGNMPLIAMDTGAADGPECELLKIGIAQSEFVDPAISGGTPTAAGRVHFYTATNAGGGAGATIDSSTPGDAALMGTLSVMEAYDVIDFGCAGQEVTQTGPQMANLINYVNGGGRAFVTHYGYSWLDTNGPFEPLAAWDPNEGTWNGPDTVNINTSFPRGQALAQWLQVQGASTTLGQLPVLNLRNDYNSVAAPAVGWLSMPNPTSGGSPATVPLYYSVDTPVGAGTTCGRLVYSDFHVDQVNGPMVFPTECVTGPMSPPEKMLEFLLFDLQTCPITVEP